MLTLSLSAVREPAGSVDGPTDAHHLAALAAGASTGIALYGGAIHAAQGVGVVLTGALSALVTAGTAWALSLPALIVLGALLGSTIPWRRAVLASLITVNFGGLAFLASIPVVVLMELNSPAAWTRAMVNVLVVIGVGSCSTLIFSRTMAHLEGHRLFHAVWMAVFGLLFVEIAWLLGLFSFTA